LLRKDTIEPFVKTGNEMAPLQDFQAFLLRSRPFGEHEEGTGRSPHHPGGSDLDEVPAGNLPGCFLRHGDSPYNSQTRRYGRT